GYKTNTPITGVAMQDRSENHTTRFTIILCTKKPPELRVKQVETSSKQPYFQPNFLTKKPQ
ncbi:MAG: hypothetical protein LBT09_03640, partial [Planctomycetaceae bacterium]|nr:hypothetical protein [Planctomycetaceae bacterium]